MAENKWTLAQKGICPVCNVKDTRWFPNSGGGRYLHCYNCNGAPIACFDSYTIVRDQNPIVPVCPCCGGDTSSNGSGRHLLILEGVY